MVPIYFFRQTNSVSTPQSHENIKNSISFSDIIKTCFFMSYNFIVDSPLRS